MVIAAAQISFSPEKSIVSAVDANNAAALALLEKVVNINSGTHNFAGVRAVGDVFRKEFDDLGFKTTWVDGAAFKRAGHLVAEHPGKGPKIVLIGHLDTVFERDSPFQKFERVDATHARGPGVIDMKGGDVIIVSAMKALKSAGILDDMNLAVVMTGDEEDSGDPQALARKALVDAAQGAQYALGFEDGPGDPKFAVIARRGTSSWKLEVTGKTGHSSQIFRPTRLRRHHELARIVDGFRRKSRGAPDVQPQPRRHDDGRGHFYREGRRPARRTIAARAVALGDPRTLEGTAHARDTMKAVVAESPLAQTQATLTFEDGYRRCRLRRATRRCSSYDKASRDLGLPRCACQS